MMVELLEKKIEVNGMLSTADLRVGLKSEVKAKANEFQFRTSFETKDLNLVELENEVYNCAKSLQAIGVDRGNKIGIYDASLDEWLVLFSACQKLGVEMINIGREFSSQEAVDELNRQKCRVFFASNNAFTFLKELMTKYKDGKATGVYPEYAIMLDSSDTSGFENVISNERFNGLSRFCSDRELEKFMY